MIVLLLVFQLGEIASRETSEDCQVHPLSSHHHQIPLLGSQGLLAQGPLLNYFYSEYSLFEIRFHTMGT